MYDPEKNPWRENDPEKHSRRENDPEKHSRRENDPEKNRARGGVPFDAGAPRVRASQTVILEICLLSLFFYGVVKNKTNVQINFVKQQLSYIFNN